MSINLGQLFVTTLATMFMIAIIKHLGKTYEVPILKELADAV